MLVVQIYLPVGFECLNQHKSNTKCKVNGASIWIVATSTVILTRRQKLSSILICNEHNNIFHMPLHS